MSKPSTNMLKFFAMLKTRREELRLSPVPVRTLPPSAISIRRSGPRKVPSAPSRTFPSFSVSPEQQAARASLGCPAPDMPLVVAYGMGVDSTAVLVQFARSGVRPDLILFADTGGEKPETYAYMPVIQSFVASMGWDPIYTVRYSVGHGQYTTLEEESLWSARLPSLAYGYKKCSLKWKRAPQDAFCRAWPVAQQTWAQGGRLVKVIGYDAGPADMRRSDIADDPEYRYWYPLRQMRMTREGCMATIASAGLPLPVKSACFFCPSTKEHELQAFVKEHPEYIPRILEIERKAAPYMTRVEGLWRSERKGTRGGSRRPGSWTEFLTGEPLVRGVPTEGPAPRTFRPIVPPPPICLPAQPAEREHPRRLPVLTSPVPTIDDECFDCSEGRDE